MLHNKSQQSKAQLAVLFKAYKQIRDIYFC